ncbi:MAG: hypothetical protein GKR97_20015 [Rhizobiaceae bacterium]|nr:hypothetical protein [Rhizobiaceae bacterium]
MIYHVQAKFNPQTAQELFAKLTDGTVADQRPDGPELVASMKRAVVNQEGNIEWSQMCFCSSPLHHERATVLDMHFDNIVTDPIDGHAKYEGQPFMEYLKGLI